MFDCRRDIILPPKRTNENGRIRQVGVEIEFAGLTVEQTATVIARCLDGTSVPIHKHRFEVRSTQWGDFHAELDSRYVQPETYLPGETSERPDWEVRLSELVSAAIGDVGAVVIPCEIVAPPIAMTHLTVLDNLILQLQTQGAQGTDRSIFYAFGLHLNPEVATVEPEWIMSIIRAQTILSSWLRSVMQIDRSRYLTGFATTYPRGYAELVLQPSYKPSLEQLIDDYIHHNPTRDRELDMLPLFAWLDNDRVRHLLPNEKIGARPTFHYRLPNAALERTQWSVVLEWNRWCLIERLADNQDLLKQLSSAYLQSGTADDENSWATLVSETLVHDLHKQALN